VIRDWLVGGTDFAAKRLQILAQGTGAPTSALKADQALWRSHVVGGSVVTWFWARLVKSKRPTVGCTTSDATP